MPDLVDIPKGKTPAEAVDVQQLVDLLTARRDAAVTILLNNALKYALTLRNRDPASRGMIIYAADGSTVLLQVDGAGVKVSPDGVTAAAAPLTQLGSSATAAAEGDHVHGVGGYSSSGTTSLETLFASTWTTVNTNYGVTGIVMFVFCTAGITVTLPSPTTTQRPISVIAISGTTTVAVSGGGSVVGGSVNVSTGAVMNGVVSAGDSITYKSDGTTWRAV